MLQVSEHRREHGFTKLIFDEISICDRVVFALSSHRNGTALVPSREKGTKARPWDMTGHFLRSGLNQKVAETRRFLEVAGELRCGFSAVQTVWRRGGDSNPRYRC
jgi:hypothetical protein